MGIDLNKAGEQRDFTPIPTGSVVRGAVRIRAGGHGEGGWLSQAKTDKGTSLYLSVELTVTEGPHKGRKVFVNFTVEGEAAGHKEAREISFQTLRAFIESAKGIKASDKSDAAAKARNIESWGELNGTVVTVKVGVEAAKGDWPAKNTIQRVITPDEVQWAAPSAEEIAAAAAAATVNAADPATPATTTTAPTVAIASPIWAKSPS